MLALLAQAPVKAQTYRWTTDIAQASRRFGVPQDWIKRVMQAESGGLTHFNGQPITSRAGAMGLMQLMPATWDAMRRAYRLGPDPHDPGDNILAGTAYLRSMYERFGYPGLFAAYNAGPRRYADHLATGRPLPEETSDYVRKVAGGSAPGQLRQRRSTARPQPESQIASLFLVGRRRSDEPELEGGHSALFAIRRAQVQSVFRRNDDR